MYTHTCTVCINYANYQYYNFSAEKPMWVEVQVCFQTIHDSWHSNILWYCFLGSHFPEVTAEGDLAPKPCISVLRDYVLLREARDYLSDDGLRKRFKCQMGIPQWFLKEGSSYTYVPSSKVLLIGHGKYRKCCQIFRDLFSKQFLKAVDRVKYIYTEIYS